MSETILDRKIEQWKRDLIDLSKRNRLLDFRPTKRGHLFIDRPDPPSVFQRLVVHKKPLIIPLRSETKGDGRETQLELNMGQDDPKKPLRSADPVHDAQSSNISAEVSVKDSTAKLETTLYHMRLRARTALEEQGVNILYVTVGFLEWYEDSHSDESVRSPILLIPVELIKPRNSLFAKIDPIDDDVVVNPTLVHALNSMYKLDMPEVPNDFGGEVGHYHEYFKQVKSLISSWPRWDVSEASCLGLFSFTKFIMVRDLDVHKQHLKDHPLINALAGDPSKLSEPPEDIPLAHELDDRVDPQLTYHVLDADSSQQEAIEAAKRGVSFVLQGPPGTGKSQTIANIIAEIIAQGKTVLFVSEKMAALQVVYNRLQKVGLEEFCLELHSHKANKKRVTQELEQCLTGGVEVVASEVVRELEQLKECRRDLNNYVRALHKSRTGMEISAFQAYSWLSKLASAPRVSLGFDDVTKVTYDQFSEWSSILQRIERNPDLWAQRKQHPWRGIRIKAFSFSFRDKLERVLRETERTLSDVYFRLEELCRICGLVVPGHIGEIKKTAEAVLALEPRFWKENGIRLVEVAKRFERWQSSFARVLNPKYWMDLWQSRHWWACKDFTVSKKAEILQVMASIQEENPQQKDTIEDSEIKSKLKNFEGCYDELQRLIDELKQLMNLDLIPLSCGTFEGTAINKMIEAFQFLLASLDELEPWMDFCAELDRAEERGLGTFLEAADPLDAHKLLSAFQRAFYERWVDNVHNQEPILQRFAGKDHEALVARFRELDRRSIENAPLRIRASLQENRPSGNWMTAQSSETAIVRREARKKRRHLPIRKLFGRIPGLLQRIKPCILMSPLSVSQYIDPEQFMFDAVVFDEASQIKPHDAVGPILRARQVIVVGDNKQLPPTSFFDRLVDNETYMDESEEDIAQFESILDECLGVGLPEKKLTWHYRSRDESLIAFSNSRFYNNELLTFPHSNPKDNGFGVELICVEGGVYDRGRSRTNRKEAARVAQLVSQHYRERPTGSLGVVAFSEAQQLAILQEMERLCKQEPDFQAWLDAEHDEPFFVKNLENVQGDERDIMIISVGYGKDGAGNLSMNFGPLNKDGGERRLNVLITRAREQVKLVSSIRATDIDLARSNRIGVQLLKEYLHYAEHGPGVLQNFPMANANNEPESPFERQVLEALRRKGLLVDAQVGVSSYRIDLAVKDPDHRGRYLLGIECDGATYHAAKTARDRDRLRQQVLERLGWNIHRIWSRDWFMHPEREIKKVLQKVEEIREKGQLAEKGITSLQSFRKKQGNPGKQKRHEKSSESKTRDDKMVEKNLLLPAEVEPYRASRMSRQGDPDEFSSVPLSSLVAIIAKIVREEGPIVESLLTYRVASAWGIARVGRRIRKTVKEAVKSACNQKELRRDYDALRLPNIDRIPIRRNGDDQSRDIEQIPLIEIAAAVKLCLKEAVSIDETELVTYVAKLFGFRRAGQKIQRRVLEAVKLLEARQEAVRQGGIVKAGASYLKLGGDRRWTR